MTTTARTTTTTVVAGVSITSIATRTEEAAEIVSLDMAAGIAGEITTRTDDNTCVITVDTGHGILDTDTIAVFWTEGVAYNGNVSAVTSTTITVDFSNGDVLPVVTYDVVVGKQASYALLLTGNNVKTLATKSNYRSLVDFRSSAPASLLTYDIEAGEGRCWIADQDVTNPLAGVSVATVHVANGGTVAATVYVGILKAA